MKWVGALALCAMTAAVAAPEWREIPYKDLHEAFSRDFIGDAKYARVTRSLRVQDENFRQEDLRLIVAATAGPIEVAIDADGTVVNFPLSQALLQENPPVRTNAPPGKLAMTMAFNSTVPPAESMPYAVIVEMTDEYNDLVRRRGVMARLMMPKPKGLLVEFGSGVDAHARIGEEVINTNAEGTLTIPLRRAWNRRPPLIQFSAMPTRLSLQLDT